MKYLLFISGTMSLVGAMTFALAGVGIASFFVSGIFGTGTWAQTDPVEQFFSVLAITLGLAPLTMWTKSFIAIQNGEPIGTTWKALANMTAVLGLAFVVFFPKPDISQDPLIIVIGLFILGHVIGQPLMNWVHGRQLSRFRFNL